MAGERTGDDGDTTHWERLAREKKKKREANEHCGQLGDHD